MNFYVDARTLKKTPWRGQQVYVYNILKQMVSLGEAHRFLLHFDSDVKLPELDALTSAGNVSKRVHRNRILAHASIPCEMVRSRSSVYYRMYNEDAQLYTPIPGKAVALILDNGKHTFPEHYGRADVVALRARVNEYIRRFACFIVISEAVKSELIALFFLDPASIYVAPPAPNLTFKPEQGGSIPQGVRSDIPFFLIVNPGYPHKNWYQMLAGFRSYIASENLSGKVSLVIAGYLGNQAEGIKQCIQAEPELRANAVCLGYVSEAELRYLYKNARAMMMLSHYEGFGIPILEAFSFQLPVIISDIPVFREVARDAALYVPIGNVDEVARSLHLIDTDAPLRGQIVARGLQLADRYTWRDSAAITLSALESAGLARG